MEEVRSYIVKLRPVTPFFFGGEKTFGNHDSQDYYAVSELVPQTSSIIGLVRFLILRNGLGLNCSDKDSIKRVIGEKGFVVGDASSEDGQDYGMLKSVSPVFITDASGAYYTRMPMDSGYCVREAESVEASHICNGMVKICYCDQKDNVCKSFKMKDFNNYKYWAKVTDDNKVEKVREDSFVTHDERIGINKGDKTKDEDNFFKQSMIRFKGSEEFVFTAEIAGDGAKAFEKACGEIVKLGASSLFKIHIESGTIDWKKEFNCLHNLSVTSKCLSKVILLSDMYLNDFQELYKNSVFVWGMSKTFRSIITDASEAHSWSKPTKSALYRVLPAGTVIFYKADKDIKNLIDIYGLKKSGFNLFV